jgi:DNA mismatch repair protein MSH3
MGAADDVARGRSTFMVELSETSEVLRLATARSLIILDELGRGTSTNDGQAIAAAVLEHLVAKESTCIFVTHYPALALVAKRYPDSVSVNHMACLETPREDGHADVTFLYRLADGLASASHGLNVARLAELPDRIIEVARVKGQELRRATEERTRQRQVSRLAEILKRTALLSAAKEGRGGSQEDKERLLDLCEAALAR